MLKLIYDVIVGELTASIGDTATLIPVDLDTRSKLQTTVDFAGGDWTYLRLSNGAYAEEVKVTGTTSNYLIVERGVSDSTPRAFNALDTQITSVVGMDAIADMVAMSPPPAPDLTIAATGIAFLETGAPNYNIRVLPPEFQGENGIEVFGSWPNITFALSADAGGCCPGDGGGAGDGEGVNNLSINSTILQGNLSGGTLYLSLQTPSFQGSGDIAVSGSWPNYTISSNGGAGTGGTTVAVGAGLSLTGNPSTNPTISISNTGVAAGDYSGFEVNARGQITQIPAGFNPISNVAFNGGGGSVARNGGNITISLDAAGVGIPGIVALADESAPLDSNDTESAVTPALLAAVLNGSGAGNAFAGTSSGEADASYNNVVSATAVAVTLGNGERALLIGEVVVLDNATPSSPVSYGVAVFDANNVKRYSSRTITQSKQSILGMITGPYSGQLSIVTTPLPGGSTLHTAGLAVVKL